MVLGDILGIITSTATSIKLSWGLLSGKKWFAKSREEEERDSLQAAQQRIDAEKSAELKKVTSNDWSKNPVKENPFFYKQIGINRLSPDNTRTG